MTDEKMLDKYLAVVKRPKKGLSVRNTATACGIYTFTQKTGRRDTDGKGRGKSTLSINVYKMTRAPARRPEEKKNR